LLTDARRLLRTEDTDESNFLAISGAVSSRYGLSAKNMITRSESGLEACNVEPMRASIGIEDVECIVHWNS
jgi:hypothetical protein